MTIKNKYQFCFIAIAIITFTTGVIFWIMAKNEIFFLCDNFSYGVKKLSVIRQLKTANLSTHKQIITEDGSRIIFSSKLNFISYKCVIDLDKNDAVVSAAYM